MTRKTRRNPISSLRALIIALLLFSVPGIAEAQQRSKKFKFSTQKSKKILYGQASYYASKFHGRKTANGEIFSHDKLTAACNVLPLGTWIKVTNLSNGKSVVVRTNDRLHTKTRRIIDLTKSAAKRLKFVKKGLTRVKIEVLDQRKYEK
jgi:rare lipoprotein A